MRLLEDCLHGLKICRAYAVARSAGGSKCTESLTLTSGSSSFHNLPGNCTLNFMVSSTHRLDHFGEVANIYWLEFGMTTSKYR